ncbi:MAG: glycosyltransferase family 2 protein [Flavobacteriaceae bacterium]
MKLSVLIPMHNASDYIERCLTSIYQQGIQERDFEVIIIDDGSTDNSVELVARFQESHSNVNLFREKNIGAYATRNKLLELAKGTFIYCMDADDYLAYDNLSKLLNTAFEEELELICFDTKVTSSEDDFRSEIPISPGYRPKISTGMDFIREHPNHRVEIWWYLIQREFLERKELVFDNNQYNADVIFTLKLLIKSNRVGYAPFSIHRYYQSPNSLMRHSDPYKKKRLLISFYSMVKDLNTYVDSVSNTSNGISEDIVEILKKRRDHFSFYFLVKLTGAGLSIDCLKRKVKSLKQLKVYPLGTYIGNTNSLKYQFLNLMINNEQVLFPLARLNRFIKQFPGWS